MAFRATLVSGESGQNQDTASHARGVCHIASFEAPHPLGDAELVLTPSQGELVSSRVRFVALPPKVHSHYIRDGLVLLTNGRGGMARMRVDLGSIHSKYDCVLGANLHPTLPVDRHILVKRIRAWLKLNGVVVAQLGWGNLAKFDAGPPAHWHFAIPLPDGRCVALELVADMLNLHNTTVFRFTRPAETFTSGADVAKVADVRLTVRVDIEDRNFHQETKCAGGADFYFSTNSHPLSGRIGFAFTPEPDRQLHVEADSGEYHHQSEWSLNIAHPVEQSRGQEGSGDAYSPGWFDFVMTPGASTLLTLTAETHSPAVVCNFVQDRQRTNQLALRRAKISPNDEFGRRLTLAMQQFVVRREEGHTIIAGYPWFLDWGRDSLIAARGLLSAGMFEEVKGLLTVMGRLEEGGTLPNDLHGGDVSHRETSDAPLWYGLVCEEAAIYLGTSLYKMVVNAQGRTVEDVLREIAVGYMSGTVNGIRMDGSSGLIWSPPHFTWMDTNYPASTPREGYPIELQALWVRLLRQLEHLGTAVEREPWGVLAERAQESLLDFYWIKNPYEDISYMADLLIAPSHCPAARGQADDALRCNYLIAVALDLVLGDKARQCVNAALRHLVIPGAVRSLAPLTVAHPLCIYGHHGGLLNDPRNPYWPRYEGDEDTRRKLAYHNGTAWTWLFPVFCEALAKAWDFERSATEAAQTYLGSMGQVLMENCIGQIPEIMDGDFPHWQRGCDAQAWGATEALRVWKLLSSRRGNVTT
jgi:predicted glycogen debranching enzyme